ncbi:MAG: transposase family protein [Deltaproteobacteria bacterium]|nr:transposase family protein [Deltaproteobacteria bacterium]
MTSHESAPRPSPILALVALTVVFRFCPSWLTVDVAEAARLHQTNAERVSRLTSRVLSEFEQAISTVTRRGRPPRDRSDDGHPELVLLRALLEIATSVIAALSTRVSVRRLIRPLVIGAWTRLSKTTPSITMARFAKVLALPVRTLREWLRTPPSAQHREPAETSAPPTSKPPRTRPPRRPRFAYDLVVPGTQLGGDTTDLCAFGVPIKLVGVQDIGARDSRLFDSVVLDERECAEHVIQAITDAIDGREGFQVLTDQGTSFLAQKTRDALDALGATHAPQREGHPQGKATVERGFGSLKDIVAPLLSLTDRLADALPALRSVELATATARLVVSVALRAYQAGARAARLAIDARAGLDEDALVRVAARAREQAIATEHSVKLWLQHVYDLYSFDVARDRFVRELRAYPLAALKDAEARLRTQLHRVDLRSLFRYFASLVRTASEEHARERALEQQMLDERDRTERAAAARAARIDHLQARPDVWLREAITMLAAQWHPTKRALLFDGAGALGLVRAALERLVALNGSRPAADIACGVFADFVLRHHDRLGDAGVDAIEAIVQRELECLHTRAHTRGHSDSTADGSPPIMLMLPLGLFRRPRPPEPLSI